MKKFSIATDSKACSGDVFHRSNFTSCPHCEAEFDHTKWLQQSVILVNTIVQRKHGSIAVISECPHCFEKSWVHQEIKFTHFDMYGLPKEWDKAAADELGRRQVESMRAWSTSLCVNCKHLKGVSELTHPWRNCIKGSGPVETECDKFKATKSPSQPVKG
jgi:hypothetical protein